MALTRISTYGVVAIRSTFPCRTRETGQLRSASWAARSSDVASAWAIAACTSSRLETIVGMPDAGCLQRYGSDDVQGLRRRSVSRQNRTQRHGEASCVRRRDELFRACHASGLTETRCECDGQVPDCATSPGSDPEPRAMLPVQSTWAVLCTAVIGCSFNHRCGPEPTACGSRHPVLHCNRSARTVRDRATACAGRHKRQPGQLGRRT